MLLSNTAVAAARTACAPAPASAPSPPPLPCLCSPPYGQREVEELCRQRDIASLAPFYLDLQDEVLRAQVGSGWVLWVLCALGGCWLLPVSAGRDAVGVW